MNGDTVEIRNAKPTPISDNPEPMKTGSKLIPRAIAKLPVSIRSLEADAFGINTGITKAALKVKRCTTNDGSATQKALAKNPKLVATPMRPD